LINEIQSDTIPIHSINQGKLNRYEATANIRRFLEACKALGLPEKDLFEPDDLVENKNWIRVVYCLQALADLAKHFYFPVQIQQNVEPLSSLQEEEVTELIEHFDFAEIAEHESDVTMLQTTIQPIFVEKNSVLLSSAYFQASKWRSSLVYIFISFLCIGFWVHFAHQSPYFFAHNYLDII
jgi:hypothetical protein